MFKPKTYLDLCMAMKTGAVVRFDEAGPRMTPLAGVINKIEREDGSGYCWNVTVAPHVTGGMADALHEPVTTFFREA